MTFYFSLLTPYFSATLSGILPSVNHYDPMEGRRSEEIRVTDESPPHL